MKAKDQEKKIKISEITDMESKPASTSMVSGLARKIEDVIKEMGITANIEIVGETQDEGKSSDT